MLSSLLDDETNLYTGVGFTFLICLPPPVGNSKSVNLAMAPGYLDVVKNPIGEGLVDERDSSLRNSSFSAVSKAGIAVFVRSGKGQDAIYSFIACTAAQRSASP